MGPGPRHRRSAVAPTRFRDVWWDTGALTGQRFALGVDHLTGLPYLAIPVSLALVDTEERYIITPDQFGVFREDPAAGARHAIRCRSGAEAARLITP